MSGGKILVAGATGHVGGAAVEYFLEAGYEVRALARSAGKGEGLRPLGAEPVIGDVTKPDTLAAALEGCAGVFSALSAGTRREAEEVEYRGNVNLLSAAREAGVRRFVYNSALLVDHPLARRVGTFREKARFEEALLGAEDISATALRPVMFMETLLMALSGPVAFVPGRQRRRVGWIPASDVARAAVAAFEKNVTGRYELAGPDTATFDEAYRRFSRVRGRRIAVLHPPLAGMRLAGRFSSPVEELASMFALFDAAGYASDSPALRGTFGVEALTIEEWAGRVSRSRTSG
ncbi:MAG: SDR family oxidoreductase [Actinobacteria bacterium]|nr:SDR family oxidoreductase [Actinomycetota bacterium]